MVPLFVPDGTVMLLTANYYHHTRSIAFLRLWAIAGISAVLFSSPYHRTESGWHGRWALSVDVRGLLFLELLFNCRGNVSRLSNIVLRQDLQGSSVFLSETPRYPVTVRLVECNTYTVGRIAPLMPSAGGNDSAPAIDEEWEWELLEASLHASR